MCVAMGEYYTLKTNQHVTNEQTFICGKGETICDAAGGYECCGRKEEKTCLICIDFPLAFSRQSHD